MNEALSQPPYADLEGTPVDPIVGALQENGATYMACVLEDPKTSVDISEFPGHYAVSLGPTHGYVRHPMGGDEMVWVGGKLLWDPTKFEVKAELLDDELTASEIKAIHDAYEADGWQLQFAYPDRVVGMRELTANPDAE